MTLSLILSESEPEPRRPGKHRLPKGTTAQIPAPRAAGAKPGNHRKLRKGRPLLMVGATLLTLAVIVGVVALVGGA